MPTPRGEGESGQVEPPSLQTTSRAASALVSQDVSLLTYWAHGRKRRGRAPGWKTYEAQKRRDYCELACAQRSRQPFVIGMVKMTSTSSSGIAQAKERGSSTSASSRALCPQGQEEEEEEEDEDETMSQMPDTAISELKMQVETWEFHVARDVIVKALTSAGYNREE